MPSMRSDFHTLKALVLGLPLVAFLPGCPVYWGDGDRLCDTAAECGPGADCVGGRCVLPECETAADCDTGESCVDFMCVAGPTTCRTHGDCPVGDYCASGTCTASGECTSDSACEATFWCDYRATCVPRDAGACRTSADCSAGNVCIEGRCEVLVDTCQFDRECPAGSACVNAECAIICSSDANCADGDACTRGFCRPAQECTTSSTCGVQEHCVDGRCLSDCRTAPTSCDANAYCAVDDFCHPDWEPRPFCSIDSDCAGGRVCREGVCRTPCPDMADSTCLSFDAQLPLCRMDTMSGDYLCFATTELMPECRVAADCGAMRACVNGVCRND